MVKSWAPRMKAPLSDLWTVEYHYNSNMFSVRSLPDYLTQSQRAFKRGKLFDSTILALHPSQQGAKDECLLWQDRRDRAGLTVKARIKEFQRYIDGLNQMTYLDD